MPNTTMITVYVRTDGKAVQVFGRIPGTIGSASWLGHPGIQVRPGEAQSFMLGEQQDLLISEVKQ